MRNTAFYLFMQDSWKIKPSFDAELWIALGIEYTVLR